MLNRIDLVSASLFPKINQGVRKAGNRSLRNLKKLGAFQTISFFRRNSFYLSDLFKEIRQKNPDVLIMQMDSNFLQISKIKSEFPDLLICCQINGSPFDEFYSKAWFRGQLQSLQRRSYSEANLNFFISEKSAQDIMGKNFDSKRDKIIENGTDFDSFYRIANTNELKKELDYPEYNYNIGYAGTLDEHKRLRILLEAVKNLKISNPDIFLTIIGDGSEMTKCRNFVEENELMNHVRFLGWIDHQKLNDHLNCWDLAVHHFAMDYMNPLKIFEYLAVGLPTIAPNIPFIKENFLDEEELLITLPDSQDLSQKISKIKNNLELQEKLSKNGSLLKKLRENYSWEKYTNRILTHISNKLNS